MQSPGMVGVHWQRARLCPSAQAGAQELRPRLCHVRRAVTVEPSLKPLQLPPLLPPPLLLPLPLRALARLQRAAPPGTAAPAHGRAPPAATSCLPAATAPPCCPFLLAALPYSSRCARCACTPRATPPSAPPAPSAAALPVPQLPARCHCATLLPLPPCRALPLPPRRVRALAAPVPSRAPRPPPPLPSALAGSVNLTMLRPPAFPASLR